MSIPTKPHWAIVEIKTIHHEGDERSRTHPGHGYPAYDESVQIYRAFETRELWEAEIKYLEGLAFRREYVAMEVFPAKIETTIKTHTAIKTGKDL